MASILFVFLLALLFQSEDFLLPALIVLLLHSSAIITFFMTRTTKKSMSTHAFFGRISAGCL